MSAPSDPAIGRMVMRESGVVMRPVWSPIRPAGRPGMLQSSESAICPVRLVALPLPPDAGEVGRPQDGRVRAGPGLDKIPSPGAASRLRPLPQAGEAI